VTIARVASRLSTNRSYQPLVLQGLKSFFDGKRRLIKQGDLLAVKVDLNQLQYLQAVSTGDGSETGTPGAREACVCSSQFPTHGLDAFYRQFIHPSNADQIVYFIVTNVDCDPPSINSALNPSDVHLGLSSGELGCWVDTTVTRVTQTGVEHVRIPDASAFLSARFLPLLRAKVLTLHIKVLEAHWTLITWLQKLCGVTIALSCNSLDYPRQY
jgi:peroxin-6